jgi:hypothetical protein
VLVHSRLDADNRYPIKRFRWAFRLANGRGCVFVSGASNVVKGKRLNYVCRLRRFGVAGPPFLFGFPDRRRPAWTILKANNYLGKNWRRVRIHAAWR